MAGLLDPRQGDGTYVENRPTRGQLLWGILEPYVMGPVNAWQGLRDADLNTLLYDTGPQARQAVENSFNVAGTMAGGSSVVPKPDDALNMGIKAFHGSPHDFDRFSLDKIGTGEGAQAYGHGLYFAENEDIAKSYRDALSPKKVAIGGQMVDSPTFFKAARRSPSVDDNIAMLTKQRENILKEQAQYTSDPELGDFVSELYDQQLRDVDKELAELSQYKGQWFGTRPGGSMYEVEIDADPDAFLDWDKPLSEQPEAVRQSLAKFDPDMYSPEGADYDPTELGQIAYQRMFHDTRKKIGPNQGAKTYQAEISKTLREAGIPGIKYLDAGSRSAGEGSRNYVVFDDNLINIIRKYGIAGLLGGSAALTAMTAEPQEQY